MIPEPGGSGTVIFCAIAAHTPKAHLDVVDPSDLDGSDGNLHAIQITAVYVAHEAALHADEVMVLGGVGVVANSAVHTGNATHQAKIGQRAEGSVDGVKRDGGYRYTHLAKDAFSIGVNVAGCDLTHDLKPLKSEPEPG